MTTIKASVNTPNKIIPKSVTLKDDTLTLSTLGIENVDNTSDVNKPISVFTQAALDLKADSTALNTHTQSTANPHNVTKTQLGLSNVNNTSDLDKPISTAVQAALNTKISSTSVYSRAEVDQKFTDLVNASPTTLDTLNELADALNNDVAFSTTVTNQLALKAPSDSPNFSNYINVAGYITATTDVTAGGDITATGDITSGALTTTDQLLATSGGNGQDTASTTSAITIDVADGGTSPALTAIMQLKGYEGRGAGIFIQDSVNSATDPSDRQWFIGTGYGQSNFNIGYAADAVQTSYTANNQLTIQTDGDVGIRTNFPRGDLHVVGKTNSAGRIYVSDRDTGAEVTDSLLLMQSGLNSFITNRADGKLVLGRESGDVITISTANNVGIGTPNPARLLTVYEDTSADSIIQIKVSDNQYASRIDFGDPELDNAGRINYEHGNNNLSFWTDNSNRMAIDGSGNVGIGVSSPSTKLEVAGELTINTASPKLNLITDVTDRKALIRIDSNGVLKIRAQNGVTNGIIDFEQFNGTTTTVPMKISSLGNIGMGTLSPAEKLSVVGNISATGNINGTFIGSLSSSVNAITANAGDSSTGVATTHFVTRAIDNLLASAPGTLDTLNELAIALGNDPNFATTITNTMSGKAPIADPSFTGGVGIGKTADAGVELDVNGDIVLSGSVTANGPISSSNHLTTKEYVDNRIDFNETTQANRNLTNVVNGSVTYDLLSSQIANSLTGSLEPQNFLGEITSLSFTLPAASSNNNKWYFVNGVSGTLGSLTIEDGGFVFSDGTNWSARGATPTNLVDDSVSYDKLTDDVQRRFEDITIRGAVWSISDDNGRSPLYLKEDGKLFFIPEDGIVIESAIQANAVTETKIANNAVTTSKIPDAAISSIKIADDAVIASKIPDGEISEIKIADDAVTSNKILDNAITEAKIANNAITVNKISDGAISSIKIADGAISQSKIPNSSITVSKLASLIGTSTIVDGAISLSKLSDDVQRRFEDGEKRGVVWAIEDSAQRSPLYLNEDGKLFFIPEDNTINTNAIQDNAVTANKIPDGSITGAKLDSNAIAGGIGDGTITQAKLVPDVQRRFEDMTIGREIWGIVDDENRSPLFLNNQGKLYFIPEINTIDTSSIQDDAVTADKIPDASITGAKIANGTISESNLNFTIPGGTAELNSIDSVIITKDKETTLHTSSQNGSPAEIDNRQIDWKPFPEYTTPGFTIDNTVATAPTVRNLLIRKKNAVPVGHFYMGDWDSSVATNNTTNEWCNDVDELPRPTTGGATTAIGPGIKFRSGFWWRIKNTATINGVTYTEDDILVYRTILVNTSTVLSTPSTELGWNVYPSTTLVRKGHRWDPNETPVNPLDNFTFDYEGECVEVDADGNGYRKGDLIVYKPNGNTSTNQWITRKTYDITTVAAGATATFTGAPSDYEFRHDYIADDSTGNPFKFGFDYYDTTKKTLFKGVDGNLKLFSEDTGITDELTELNSLTTVHNAKLSETGRYIYFYSDEEHGTSGELLLHVFDTKERIIRKDTNRNVVVVGDSIANHYYGLVRTNIHELDTANGLTNRDFLNLGKGSGNDSHSIELLEYYLSQDSDVGSRILLAVADWGENFDRTMDFFTRAISIMPSHSRRYLLSDLHQHRRLLTYNSGTGILNADNTQNITAQRRYYQNFGNALEGTGHYVSYYDMVAKTPEAVQYMDTVFDPQFPTFSSQLEVVEEFGCMPWYVNKKSGTEGTPITDPNAFIGKFQGYLAASDPDPSGVTTDKNYYLTSEASTRTGLGVSDQLKIGTMIWYDANSSSWIVTAITDLHPGGLAQGMIGDVYKRLFTERKWY